MKAYLPWLRCRWCQCESRPWRNILVPKIPVMRKINISNGPPFKQQCSTINRKTLNMLEKTSSKDRTKAKTIIFFLSLRFLKSASDFLWSQDQILKMLHLKKRTNTITVLGKLHIKLIENKHRLTKGKRKNQFNHPHLNELNGANLCEFHNQILVSKRSKIKFKIKISAWTHLKSPNSSVHKITLFLFEFLLLKYTGKTSMIISPIFGGTVQRSIGNFSLFNFPPRIRGQTNQETIWYKVNLTGGFFGFFSMYCIQHCLLHLPPLRFHCVGGCGIEPRAVAISALAVRRSNH